MILNELPQGLRATAEGVEWFEGLPEDDQRKVLQVGAHAHRGADVVVGRC
ncbi:DUF5958 family protein [Streptomyces violaceus]